MTDGHFEGSLAGRQAHRGTGKKFTEGGQSRVTIDTLPDLALIEIFDFYMYEEESDVWRTLVHVCRKWRSVVFGSPRRLNLRLLCKVRTFVRDMLDIWPPLPIIVCDYGDSRWGMDNLIAVLEHKGRICQLDLLHLPDSQLETVLAIMQQPFPALTHLVLQLQFGFEPVPVVPASFLGGSAPHLQSLRFNFIPFPGLPKLLLSATHLVDLGLVLTKLENLTIDFGSPRSSPKTSRHPSPQTRTLLPVLTSLYFGGVKEYLEDLVAQIDVPLLDQVTIAFFHQRFDSNIPQLTKFFGRTPKLKAHDEARGLLYELKRSCYISV